MLIYKYNTYHFKISSLRSHIFFCRLMSGLWILILGGFLQIFIGGEITQTAMAIGGAILFSGKIHKLFEKNLFSKIAEPHISGFIIFDTQMIMTRVSPEEYVIATIELYLDIINLFLEILKILDKINRK